MFLLTLELAEFRDLTLVMRMQRVFEVDAGQDGKDVGLNGRHQNFERVNRDNAEDRNESESALLGREAC